MAQVCAVPDYLITLPQAPPASALAPTSFTPHRAADWPNYRLNLWRCITPRAVGKHARFLVPLFLKFVE